MRNDGKHSGHVNALLWLLASLTWTTVFVISSCVVSAQMVAFILSSEYRSRFGTP